MTVTYKDETHEYFIDGRKVPSVTQLLQKMHIVHSFDDMDKKMYEEVVMPKAIRGTKIHDALSEYIMKGVVPENEEDIDYRYIADKFSKIVGEKFHRDEWYWISENLIYTDIYAGRTDLVCINDKTKQIACVDYKTGSYTTLGVGWQTSLYLYGFCFVNPKYRNYERSNFVYNFDELLPLTVSTDGEIDNLLYRYSNEFYDMEAQSMCSTYAEKLADIEKIISKMKEGMKPYEEAKEHIINMALGEFKNNAIRSIDRPEYIVTYSPSSTSFAFDETRFALEHEDLYREYCTKEKTRKSSIKVTLRKPKNEEEE